ncbi:MAG: DUF1156 domain-containing protein, partial [Halobacteriaceae archaeon]
MSENNNNEREESKENPRNYLITDNLPIRAVGIESQRERMGTFPPMNRLHVWWARRPIAISRLAILGSVLPDDIDDDTLLRWMGVQPDNIEEGMSAAEHVRKKKKTKDQRDGLVYEHYGYRSAFKNH